MNHSAAPSHASPSRVAPANAPATHYRSKTLASWLAVLLGPLGVHRLYLKGLRDVWAWLHPLPTALGLIGVSRMSSFGQDDRLAMFFVPVLGLMISLSMLTAIVWGLTPDERWDERHNGGRRGAEAGWAVVIAVILSLLVGGGVLMGTIAYSIQHFFEWQLGL